MTGNAGNTNLFQGVEFSKEDTLHLMFSMIGLQMLPEVCAALRGEYAPKVPHGTSERGQIVFRVVSQIEQLLSKYGVEVQLFSMSEVELLDFLRLLSLHISADAEFPLMVLDRLHRGEVDLTDLVYPDCRPSGDIDLGDVE